MRGGELLEGMKILEPGIYLLAKRMDCRGISAFTCVFRRAMPAMTNWIE
jgi:hypothetical protein